MSDKTASKDRTEGTINKAPKKPSRSKLQKTRAVLGWWTGVTVCSKVGFFLLDVVKRQGQYVVKGYKDHWDDASGDKVIPDDTFAKTVKRHKLTKAKLVKIRAELLLKKRIFTLSLLLGLWCLGMGMFFAHFQTVLVSMFAVSYFAFQVLQNSFRVWQIDKRELASLGDFGNDGGWIRALHFFNGRTVSPNTIRFLGFLTVAVGWSATLGQAWANTASVSYYIDLARNDQSMKMLGQLFGSIGGLWFGESTPLAVVFLGYNTAVMSAGILFLLYTASSGFIQTSQEGEVFGKRFSTIWLPIRLTVGTVGILPMFGGWSGAQAIMFFGTALGIGFANAGWQVGAPAMVSHIGSLKTPGTYKIQAADITSHKEVMKAIIESQLCVIGYNNESGYYNDRPKGAHIDPPNRKKLVEEGTLKKTDSRQYLSFGGPGGDVPENLCGKIEFPGSYNNGNTGAAPKGASITQFKEAREALNSKSFDPSNVVDAHMSAMSAVSQSLVESSREYFFKGTPIKKEVLRQIGQEYSSNVATKLGNIAVNSGKTDFSKYMKGDGKSWLTAGAVFFKLMQVNSDIVAATTLPAEYLPPEVHKNYFQAEYPGLKRGALRYEGFAKETMREHEDTDHPKKTGKSKFTSMLAEIADGPSLTTIINGLSNHDEGFLFKIIAIGTKIFALAIASIGAVMAGGAMPLVGDGVLAFGLVMVVVPLLYIGMTMMIFIPMVPAIMWFGGVVTYFVIVVEAFAASPLWMITHFHGEGDGMGHKSAHGYMFLLNLVFRPILMIIGFLAAWLLLDILGSFLISTFETFWQSFESANFLVQFFQFLGVLVAVSTVANGLVQKLFSMVTFLPDQVITWVGGHAAKFGQSDDDAVKSNIGAVAAQIRGSAGPPTKKPKSKAKGSSDHPESDGGVKDVGEF